MNNQLRKVVTAHLMKGNNVTTLKSVKDTSDKGRSQDDKLIKVVESVPVAYDSITVYKVNIKGVGGLNLSKDVIESLDTVKRLKAYFYKEGVEIDNNTACIVYGKVKEAIKV
jgi:hypothetical protein